MVDSLPLHSNYFYVIYQQALNVAACSLEELASEVGHPASPLKLITFLVIDLGLVSHCSEMRTFALKSGIDSVPFC